MKKIFLTTIFGFGLIINAMASTSNNQIEVKFDDSATYWQDAGEDIQNKIKNLGLPNVKKNLKSENFETELKTAAKNYLTKKDENALKFIRASLSYYNNSLSNAAIFYISTQKGDLYKKIINTPLATVHEKSLWIEHSPKSNDFDIIVGTHIESVAKDAAKKFYLSPSCLDANKKRAFYYISKNYNTEIAQKCIQYLIKNKTISPTKNNKYY